MYLSLEEPEVIKPKLESEKQDNKKKNKENESDKKKKGKGLHSIVKNMKIIVNEAHFEVKLLPRNDNNEIWAPQLRFDVYDISIQSTNGNWEVRIDSFVSFSSLAEFSLFLILSTLFSPLISSPSSFIPLNPPSFISPLLSSILSFNSSLFLSSPSFIPLPSSFPPFFPFSPLLFPFSPFPLLSVLFFHHPCFSLALLLSSIIPSSFSPLPLSQGGGVPLLPFLFPPSPLPFLLFPFVVFSFCFFFSLILQIRFF